MSMNAWGMVAYTPDKKEKRREPTQKNTIDRPDIMHQGMNVAEIAEWTGLTRCAVQRRWDAGKRGAELLEPKLKPVTVDGYTLQELANKTHISKNTLRYRYNRGMRGDDLIVPAISRASAATMARRHLWFCATDADDRVFTDKYPSWRRYVRQMKPASMIQSVHRCERQHVWDYLGVADLTLVERVARGMTCHKYCFGGMFLWSFVYGDRSAYLRSDGDINFINAFTFPCPYAR